MPGFLVEHDSPLSVWGQIHRDLRHSIDAGTFSAGQRIPTEVALMEHYGVSRVTIRRSIRALTDDGYLRARRGSGTYVTDRAVALVCDLDLSRPWREQLLIDGHIAQSHLVETTVNAEVPPEILAAFSRQPPPSPLTFSRTVQIVNDLPIGVTESWRATSFAARGVPTGAEEVAAECFAEVGFATAVHAKLLRSYLDIPIIEVSARTRFVGSGEIAEYARTAWLGSRVRLAYERRLTLAELDIAQLIGAAGPAQ